MTSTNDESGLYVQVTGLPTDPTPEKSKIFEHFKACDVEDVSFVGHGIKKEEPSDEVILKLKNKDGVQKALAMNNSYFNEKFYIQVEKAEAKKYELINKSEVEDVTDGNFINKSKNSSEDKQNEQHCYAKLSGLVWSATEADLNDFLRGCDVSELFLTVNEKGKPTGEAFARFRSRADLLKALKLKGEKIGSRWVDIKEIQADLFLQERSNKRDHPKTTTILNQTEEQSKYAKLKGLVWSATEADVKKFLAGCEICEVFLTVDDKEKPSGEAFVMFKSLSDLEKGLKYQGEKLGARWVDIKEIGEKEFLRERGNMKMELENPASVMQVHQPDSSSKFYVKLSGLDWAINEIDIENFLKDCSVDRVIITKNEFGKSTGISYVELLSENGLKTALNLHKRKLGKRWVNIEKVSNETFESETGIFNGVEFKKTVKRKRYFKLSNLPWSASEADIRAHFKDCTFSGIVITYNEYQKPSGFAFASMDVDGDPLKFNQTKMEARSISVFEITEKNFLDETIEYSRRKSDEDIFSSTEVTLSNLPWELTDTEIKDFLKDCVILKISIIQNEFGKPSGSAKVQLSSTEDQAKALICNNSTLKGRKISVKKTKLEGNLKKEIEVEKSKSFKENTKAKQVESDEEETAAVKESDDIAMKKKKSIWSKFKSFF